MIVFEKLLFLIDTTKADDETMAPQNGMDVDDDMTQDPDATTGSRDIGLFHVVLRLAQQSCDNSVLHLACL